METTIQVSSELLERLRTMKIYSKESYESIIWDLVEDRLEFSESTKKNIEQSEKEIKEGKTISLEVLKRKIGG
jgi:predicted transcriptional regulator